MIHVSLGGGGWKGMAQVPICLEIEAGKWGEVNRLSGTSVGAINGALTSAGKMKSVGEPLWDSIDDRNIVDGIKGFLRPLPFGDALFDLKPIDDLMIKHLALKDLKVPFGAGVVVRQTHKHHILWSKDMTTDLRLRNSVIASAAISFLMSPVKMPVGDLKDAIVADGGHRWVLPIPDDLKKGDKLIVVSCNPIEQEPLPTPEVDGRMEALCWTIETMMSQAHERSIDKLKLLAANGVDVTLYAPRSSYGGLLKADKATLIKRKAEGEWMLDNPIKF